jgi:hypothetical protein
MMEKKQEFCIRQPLIKKEQELHQKANDGKETGFVASDSR